MAPRLPRLVPDGGGPRYYYFVSPIVIALSQMVIAEPAITGGLAGSDLFPHMADEAVGGGQVAPLSGACYQGCVYAPQPRLYWHWLPVPISGRTSE